MSSSGARTSGLGDHDIRPPLDPHNLPDGASEFGWGAGLEPPSDRGKSVADGGRYSGLTPPSEPDITVSRR